MKILVAEDDPKICVCLQQDLSEASFAVHRVENGSEVLQQALAEAYDLLILDVMIPGLDGWEVLRRLRGAGQALPAELRPLVSSFNGMLARLDEFIVRLSNFPSDITH